MDRDQTMISKKKKKTNKNPDNLQAAVLILFHFRIVITYIMKEKYKTGQCKANIFNSDIKTIT